MSVKIICERLVKKYGDMTVIPDLSLQINEGEFFTLLGPSGCGKTTLLRMIAGFNSIESGTISFNGTVINALPPEKRNIGMVFQNYAVFPHMNVSKNIEFGLKTRHLPKDEIERRLAKILETVQVTQYKDRMPEELSGGQQQRVALARAIVIEPDVLLMDEPLSNLDAKLRVDMRNAIKEIQNDVNITTVYVTHDQEEAMAVSDRIAVMNSGVIQQVGTPRDIYRKPANEFVATFIGRTAILDATLFGKNCIDFGGYIIKVPWLNAEDGKVRVSVRPEDFLFSSDNTGLRGKMLSSVFLGSSTHYFVALDTGKTLEIIENAASDADFAAGDVVYLKIRTERINVFNDTGSRNLA